MTKLNNFKVFKHVLPNGLTILVKPQHTIPRVESHLWYNIGSKDEGQGEQGITHLIEHMLFKGTKNLSESDLNLITHKLSGISNAFTSHDATCYTFRFPSNVWQESLALFAECMQNATFDPQTLASELKAVIEEFRLYQDDYQGLVVEKMIEALWPQHPYRTPVLGLKQDICNIGKEKLLEYYKKHYHPANATLVVAGDVQPDEVFKLAETHFGKIPGKPNYKKHEFLFEPDIQRKTVQLFRDIQVPWCCYFFEIPGLRDGQNYIFDAASLLLGGGKSSRLHKKLVEQTEIAVEVACSIYEFFDRGLFAITVYPKSMSDITEIEQIINLEILELQKKLIADWEMESVKKRAQVDFTTLLEDTEKQAAMIGNLYLATKDESAFEKYMEKIEKLDKKQIQNFFIEYFSPATLNAGYLYPILELDKPKFHKLQAEADKQEAKLLEKLIRSTPVEGGKWVTKVNECKLQKFSYPKLKSFTLDNGLVVTFYNNPTIPSISAILNFKANNLYDEDGVEGCFIFLIRLMLERTKKYDAKKMAQMLETNGIYIGNLNEVITFKCLNQNFEQALDILYQILTQPSFDAQTISKIKHQAINELKEFWDTPLEFIEQITREHIYQNHPYSKNPVGNLKSIPDLTAADLKKCFKKYISPANTNLIIVGDLSNIDLEKTVKKYLGTWNGLEIPDLEFPAIILPKDNGKHINSNRDQTVITIAAPSVSRKSPEYNALAILDVILTGGPGFSSNSRLFDLREKYGLFYAIGGSLVYGAKEEPGLMLIKTLVSHDKVEKAKKLILASINDLGQNGIIQDEFEMAKNMILSSLVENFESNMQTASAFLFLQKFKLDINLFDKMGDTFSIIKIEEVNRVAKKFCRSSCFSFITVGRARPNR
ncbi:MAG: pitrilysin family protein [bacterium]